MDLLTENNHIKNQTKFLLSSKKCDILSQVESRDKDPKNKKKHLK